MTGSTPGRSRPRAAGPVHVGVKEAVRRSPASSAGFAGPEMRSTGEVLELDARFGAAFAKNQEAAYGALPLKGVAFLSVRNADKRAIVPAKRLADLGFTLVATTGTAGVLRRNGVEADVVRKGHEGPDNVVDRIEAGDRPGRQHPRRAGGQGGRLRHPHRRRGRRHPPSPPVPASPPSSRESRPAWPATWPSAPSRPGMRTADDPGPGARRGAGAAPEEYHSLILAAPRIADGARPGQFVHLQVPEDRSLPLRRPFSIRHVERPGAVEVVFEVVGAGTRVLAGLRPHQAVDTLGPLGRPFRPPAAPASCLLVGGGYGARCSSWPAGCGRGAAPTSCSGQPPPARLLDAIEAGGSATA